MDSYTVEEEITYGVLADSTTAIAIHVLYIQVYDERGTLVQGLDKGQLYLRAFIGGTADFEYDDEGLTPHSRYQFYLEDLIEEWGNA